MNSTRKALIVGCGISGPVAALFLKRIGVESVIYESKRKPPDQAGAFLNLMPNGIHVLSHLGLLEQVRQHGHSTERFVFKNSQGNHIGEMDLPGIESPHGVRSILISRGTLSRLLREAAENEGIAVKFGKKLVGLQDRGSQGVTARFEDESTARGDFLVGCDGVHSRTREIILPDFSGPSYVGLINVGSINSGSTLPASTTMVMTFGKKAFFGYQSVPGNETYWFSNASMPEPRRESLGKLNNWKRRLIELHDADASPIPEIIRATEGPLAGWPTYDLPSLPTWFRGRICLVGDAAHAVSPSAGQGASLALEDAMVLAKCLRDASYPEDAFETYERLRKSRAERVVQQGRRNGNNKATSNPVMRWIRDRMMPLFSKLGAKATAEISAYRIDWETKAA